VWRRLMWRRKRPIICENCGGEARIADKSVILEAVGGQILILPMLLLFVFLPWWAAIAVAVAIVFAFELLIDALIPLVAKEPFGSRADVKRATIHFWLVAPIALIVTVVLFIEVVKAIARAA
jgi:hypothetical protein